MSLGMPRRVETEHLVLRPWTADDVDRLLEAITSSLDHLRAWLTWAQHEPESIDAKLGRIRSAVTDFESGARWMYGLFDPAEARILGGVGIESVSNSVGQVADPRIAREIGYWVRADSLRRGLCSEAVGVLTALAFRRADLEHVEIQCDPRNRASARVPERLGYRHVATRVANKRAPGGEPRDTMIWVMTREELDRTPAAAFVHRVSGD